MNKSTKRRLITSIICFTACASLVGVGFSLWTAGNGSASASGEGDLVTTGDIVTTSNDDINLTHTHNATATNENMDNYANDPINI